MTTSDSETIAELTAILGDDPVGRAKALAEDNAVLRSARDELLDTKATFQLEADSLRAALAEKDALLAELTDADDWLRQLLAAQDRIKELEAETARLQARVSELEHLHTFLREHGIDLMLYTKPQVEGLKRPCRDALGEVMKRMVEK